jgi:hypothetical protein
MPIAEIMELFKYGFGVVLACGLFYLVYIWVKASIESGQKRDEEFFKTLESYRGTIESHTKESAEAHSKVVITLDSLVTSTKGLENAVARINGYK